MGMSSRYAFWWVSGFCSCGLREASDAVSLGVGSLVSGCPTSVVVGRRLGEKGVPIIVCEPLGWSISTNRGGIVGPFC